MATPFMHRAELALMTEYTMRGPDGLPRGQQAQFEEAQAHYRAGMTIAAALAQLPQDEADEFKARLDKAVDAVADTDEADADWPFVLGSLKATLDNLKLRAAGLLAQADIDRAMEAVREEMAFDRTLAEAAAGHGRKAA
ncbi:hypothetical protein SAMN02949497_3452 [Methylomagnum ishizawai]|uniref:Uncharacterized protein n=1 Tax=Methylomagnum ishizawai TaxID=1760988 RepID=A0A1Y6D0F1_9GAMM|nr:hypothetical protein [Methylomagnum ishizawai]SMF96071.1 hypothetical protein SAMN02949497_3452 [Methylomagnum ishizawai]